MSRYDGSKLSFEGNIFIVEWNICDRKVNYFNQSCIRGNDYGKLFESGSDGRRESNVDFILIIGAQKSLCENASTLAFAGVCNFHGDLKGSQEEPEWNVIQKVQCMEE